MIDYSSKGGVFEPPEFVAADVLKGALRSCGVAVKVYHGSRIYPGDVVSLGSYCQIDEGVRIFGGVETTLGRNVHMAFSSSISGGGTCHLGDYVSIGAGVRILTGTDLPQDGMLNNPTIPDSLRAVERHTTIVEALALIFTNTVVFPGVRIGEGAVVAAGSVVHRDLSPWTVYAGNPLVAIGKRDGEKGRSAAESLNLQQPDSD